MFHPNYSSIPSTCTNYLFPINDSRFVGKTGRFIGMTFASFFAWLLFVAIGGGVSFGMITILLGGIENATSDSVMLAVCAIPATLGLFLGTAWGLLIRMRWMAKHTVINGCPIIFYAKLLPFTGTIMKWFYLSVVTLFIYALWLPIIVRKWKWNHTIVDYKSQMVEIQHVCGAQSTMPSSVPKKKGKNKHNPEAAMNIPMAPTMPVAHVPTPIPQPIPMPMPLPTDLPIMQIPSPPHPANNPFKV
jgi:hypothetical protein